MPDNTHDSGAAPGEILQPGTKAPSFSLNSTPDQKVTLDEFAGRPLVVAFYPADFSPVCSDELALYNEVLPEIQKHDAQLVAVSVDGPWCHAAFAKERNLHFPLLADFEPKGEVSRAFGVYDGQTGQSRRALFLVDGEGTIVWSYLSPVGVNPGVDGVLRALEEYSGAQGVPDAGARQQTAAAQPGGEHSGAPQTGSQRAEQPASPAGGSQTVTSAELEQSRGGR
jgi:peroxiredoxin